MTIYPWDNQHRELTRWLDDNASHDDVIPGAAYILLPGEWRVYDDAALREFVDTN